MRLFKRRISPLVADEITVYDILSACRVTMKISRATMAEMLGTDVTYILDFEAGRIDARLSQLRQYAFALGALLEFRVTREIGENDQ